MKQTTESTAGTTQSFHCFSWILAKKAPKGNAEITARATNSTKSAKSSPVSTPNNMETSTVRATNALNMVIPLS